ncbi:phage integrase N-terminal SAM-like domain-containing protein [Bradyrhizobium sp. 146]|nr:phage integrase N-terminal SAM-like domain-containing protein [Bradyrhizobium sp. 146]MCK1702220.1 phage integrase N-terminal SAM-like domain-containing protein [Bradyrhizobium sp. 146]
MVDTSCIRALRSKRCREIRAYFVPDTQREYIRAVKRLRVFLSPPPDSATAEELRAFQLHLTEALRRWTPGASPICASRSHGKPCGMPLREYWRNRRGAPSG